MAGRYLCAVLLSLLQLSSVTCASAVAVGHHRSTRSVPEIRRYMDLPDHFYEHCFSSNCSAAAVLTSDSETAPTCSLVRNNTHQFTTNNHNVEVHESDKYTVDEKIFYAENGATFSLPFPYLTTEWTQFPSAGHRYQFYDPTRYPPVFAEWRCAHKAHGQQPCHLPSTRNDSNAAHGICRHVCDYKLVMRLVRKKSTCVIPYGPHSILEGAYVWAWCREAVPVHIYCAPANEPDTDDICTSPTNLAKACHTFDTFESE